MYNSIMIDIETLSNTPRSVIVTIGVCEFNPDTGAIGEGKCIYINPQDAQNQGAEISAGTVMWWMDQSREAQKALISTHAITLKAGLMQLTDFIVEARDRVPGGNLAIYANDPNFDLTILENSYTLCGLSTPWAFWEHKSCRTFVMLGKRYGFTIKTDFPREGTAHNALDDAIYQASYINKIQSILDAGMGISET